MAVQRILQIGANQMDTDKLAREKENDRRVLKESLLNAGIASAKHLIRVKAEILDKWLNKALPDCEVIVSSDEEAPNIQSTYRIEAYLDLGHRRLAAKHTVGERFLQTVESPIDRIADILARNLSRTLIEEVGL